MDKCCICSFPASIIEENNSVYKYNCTRCGEYLITLEAKFDIDGYIISDIQKGNLSGWIRDHQNEIITQTALVKLSKIKTPSVDEKALRILLYLSNLYPMPGQELPNFREQLNSLYNYFDSGLFMEFQSHHAKFLKELPPLFSIGWSHTLEEVFYLLYEYLGKEKEFFTANMDNISPKGWAFIEKYKSSNEESNTVFIAIKFEKELLNFNNQWVEAAVEETGYNSIRMDKKEHNNLIDDEIISNIRRSRFMIADLTANSFGVYYESGFARGMNIPVIYICNEDYFNSDKNKVHFDAGHYPFILWNYDNGEELKKKLIYRILATIGQGNIKVK